jgi:mRNA interferase RelE/StbE
MATPHVPTYTILTLAAARRQITRLQKSHNSNLKTIFAAIMSLAENPRPTRSKKLENRAELRIRVGDYRIVYLVDDILRTVTICAVGHRRDVYRYVQ